MKNTKINSRTIVRGFIASTLLLGSGIAMANKPYIDPVQAQYQTEKSSTAKKLCPMTTFGKYKQCTDKFYKEWDEKHPLRGSDAYCETHYNKLTEAEAKAKATELYEAAKGARSGVYTFKDGEVSSGQLEGEALWIRINILHAKVLDSREMGFGK